MAVFAAAVPAAAGLSRSARTRTVRLKPRRRLIATRGSRFTVRLRVTATDRAGNRRTKTKTIRAHG